MSMDHKELRTWCRENWRRVPHEDRVRCLNHLRGWMPLDILGEWRNDGFPSALHLLGGGMQIRNRLRDVLADDLLPSVEQSDGSMARNWDDFYTGALDELMEQMP